MITETDHHSSTWSERRLELDGHAVRVATRGRGDQLPLLLITGIGAHIEMWNPFVDLLGDRPLIAFDAPGTGESDTLCRPVRMRGMARYVEQILDRLGVERVDVLGYSWGGALAQEVARRLGYRIRRLVLCATGPGLGGVPPRPLAGMLLATPTRYLHPVLMEWSLPHIAGGRTGRQRHLVREQERDRLAHAPTWSGYANQLWAIAGWSSVLWLRKLNQRILVVVGSDDPTIPVGNARIIAALAPRARLWIVPGGGHLMLIDEPWAVAGPVQRFLDWTSPRPYDRS